jgi:hypothetical protein
VTVILTPHLRMGKAFARIATAGPITVTWMATASC